MINQFESYLKLELNFSPNSIYAYISDIGKLHKYLEQEQVSLIKVTRKNLENFLICLHEIGLSPRSQARIISSIRNFYSFLFLEKQVESNPANVLELPKLSRKLPEVLEPEEIQQMIDLIDLSHQSGERNKAILELLYSSGPRVSEVVNLETQNLCFEDELVIFTGKGNKQRVVPLGNPAIKQLKIYLNHIRKLQVAKKGHEKYFFLNLRGAKLSRNYIFMLIQELALKAQIKRKVGPHTFRHSFATSLVERGADLRAVQQMLGHESITTTEIYTHLDRTYLKDVIKEFHPRS